jgi:hypothetical protein
LQSVVLEIVRWPGKSSGAIGFALIFLLLFLSRKKVNNELFFQEKRWNTIDE